MREWWVKDRSWLHENERRWQGDLTVCTYSSSLIDDNRFILPMEVKYGRENGKDIVNFYDLLGGKNSFIKEFV